MARFIFAQAGAEYEDKRITSEEFGKLKPTLLTGSLPVLEIDDKMLTGSGPINRYLAEEFGLSGKDSFERAKIDGIVDVVDDLFGRMVATVFADPAVKEKLEKRFAEEDIPKYLGILETIISTNNSSEGWAFGNKVTYADMKIAVEVGGIIAKEPAVGEKFPSVKKCIDAVNALPKIAEWIKDRPDTPF